MELFSCYGNNTPWRWESKEINAFEALKQSMSSYETVSYFDVMLPTELINHASPIGLGAVLTQKTPDGEMKITEYGTSKLSDTKSRYSQLEREDLAVVL